MKTDDLIRSLALDDTPPVSLGRALLYGFLPGMMVSLIFYGVAIGPRPHLLDLLPSVRILFKIAFPIAVFACAGPLALQVARPRGDPRPLVITLLVLLAILVAAVGIELLVVPPDLWRTRLIGHNARVCLTLIPTMSAAPLVGALIALHRGAPSNPGLAGAVAGLTAGAFGAALYATHCPDDSPLFVATWYSLAILIVITVGALAGSRVLRW
jgi:hypothetical protein